MRVTFLGTGTSSGVPVIGCQCDTCRSTDRRDQRWRPSVYIQLADGTSVLVDTATDLRAQALAFGISRVDVIVFTHSHADHVLGLDDVRIFNFRQRAPIPCYGDDRTLQAIRRMFAYAFDPATPRAGGLPELTLLPIDGPWDLGGRTFIPVPIYHGAQVILGYRVGRFAYLTDCSAIPDSSWALLDRLDVLVLDALRRKAHPTHFSLAQAVETARGIGARQTYFTHIAHDLAHAATCAELPAGMSLAYDGLVVEVD